MKNLNVFPDCRPNSTDRLLQLVGPPDKCAQTVIAVLKILNVNSNILAEF